MLGLHYKWGIDFCIWTNLAKFINNLCLSPNEDVRARYVSSNWIQSPKKKKKGKKKTKGKGKERNEVGLGSK